MGKSYGVALLSEALVERFSPREVAELQDVDRDAQGNIRVTEIDLGRKVKNEVQMRLEQRGIKVTIVDKTIGYELRCAPPIPFDAEYARDLGYAAVTYLLKGGSGALVTIQGGEFTPIPFADVLDAERQRAGGVPWTSRPRAIRWRGSTWCGSALATSRTRRGSPRSPRPPASTKTRSAPGSADSPTPRLKS